jgi:preprotein translocase subunit SecY
MMRALYGQAQALPASLFELGISPHINASIIITIVLLLPKDLLPFPWADRLREARKEGKGVSTETDAVFVFQVIQGLIFSV